MKYFLDTEFKEYHKKPLFGNPIPTIDLISIGIVAEDGRQYYALNKECDLKEVWKDEWLRENVLAPIYTDKIHGDLRYHVSFNLRTMRWIFKGFGDTKEQMVNDIVSFVGGEFIKSNYTSNFAPLYKKFDWGVSENDDGKVEFYGYYCDYDWVVFCQLFGRMADLPKGLPMYCRDLKQIIDEKGIDKSPPDYPKQKKEHNALYDAVWNAELYQFIKNL